MNITSPNFSQQDLIPSLYTCQGKNINPELTFTDVPKEARSLVLIMDDPDAPMRTYVHWVLYDIPPHVTSIPKDSSVGTQGINTSGKLGYVGPCPPSGVHRYYFKLYALDALLNLKEGVTKEQILQAMEGHILQTDELVGLYEKA
jgi:Raf kinase inhibitor-like YbhB/YbcL family protein